VWHEIEVELVDGDRELLKRVDTWLRAHGARRSSSPSKLARTLGLEPVGSDGPHAAERVTAKSTAGEVIGRYLREQVETIRERDPQVRLEAADAVHKMRVASRRLRSALQTFKPLVAVEPVRTLRAELKWLAGELGAARDAEVQRDTLDDALDAEDRKKLLDRGARRTVDGHAAREHRAALSNLKQVMDSDRYRDLITRLDELIDNPPMTARAGRPAAKVLPKRVARSYDKVARAMTEAASLTPGPERDGILHAARKAAKRSRYAAEAVSPAFGKPARRFAAAMEDVQEELGQYHDGVVLLARLHELALEQDSAAAAFTYGRLHAQQEAQSAAIDDRIASTWKRASRGSLRHWLP
jgi:CHAD domain-containing protein